MKVIAILILSSILHLSYAGVCEDRKETVKEAIAKNDSQKNHEQIKSKNFKLVVLGEPHGTHYLEKLPLIIPFLTKNLRCAFIEQPYQLEQVEIDELLQGNKTKHFQTDASFEYIPFLKYLRDHNIEIIPIDNRLDHANGISALEYMTKRDDGMFERIRADLERCKSSLYLVGKHHITPDISGYNETLGHRLRKLLKDQVLLVDMIAHKNMDEEYCSYSQNNLFDSKNILLKSDLVGDLSYSSFVSHSFWRDFDYILHLNRDVKDEIKLD